MPQFIGLEEVRKLIDEGAQLVEVLPTEEYEEEHLPGAVNISLKKFGEEAPEKLDKDRPVIVYCWDYQ